MNASIMPDLTDSEREVLIKECRLTLQNDELSPDEKQEIWQKMKGLINARSAEQVTKMEIEQGLVEPEIT